MKLFALSILIWFLLFELHAFGEAFIVCCEGSNIVKYSVFGKILKISKTKYIPDHYSYLNEDSIVYSIGKNKIVIESLKNNIIQVFPFEIDISGEEEIRKRLPTQFSEKSPLTFKNHMLYDFCYNKESNQVAFIAVPLEVTEIDASGLKTVFNYKELYDLSSLWNYSISDKKLSLLVDLGFIENPFYYRKCIAFSNGFVFKKVIGKEVSNLIISPNLAPWEHYYKAIIKISEEKLFFTVYEKDQDLRIKGIFVLNLKTDKLFELPFNEIHGKRILILDIIEDEKKLLVSDKDKEEVRFLDLKNHQEFRVSILDEAPACFH